MPLAHNACSAFWTEAMAHRHRSKFIILQCAFPSLNSKLPYITREDPFVALLEADTAVADSNRGDLRDFENELESATMAVSMVSFKLGRWGFGRHCC